ncbi:helix-turn-helix domain-containing protein [Paenibacillus pinihumi]|uniref:helix-turn-helix domain-containing protein n=1 Tax=Paenibacillus pinihumi TaxID=669462 RepID=UPI0004015173|nr:helix-turn-helix transcriptional regulator [Paenibacillus pinihumi]
MKIKIRLKEILEERGMSQRKLARQMGLRPSTINHLCSDSVDRVYIRTLENICDALGITVDELLVSVEEDEVGRK